MSAYRAVITGTLGLMVITVLSFLLLNDEGTTAFAAFLLIALILVDWIATAYVWRLVTRDQRRPRSWLLLMLGTTTAMSTTGLTIGVFVLTRRLFGYPALDAGLGLRLLAIGLILIGFVPVMKAALFFLVQRDPTAQAGERIEDRVAADQ